MSAIQSLYTKRSELKSQIEAMAGKKGVGQLRQELEMVNARLAQLDLRRQQMKANINSQNASGRGGVNATRIALQSLADAKIGRGYYDELVFRHSSAMATWYEAQVMQRCPTHPNIKRFSGWMQAKRTLQSAIKDGVIEAADADFDKKGRGTATNHDLYAYSHDGTLILVQVRHATVSKYGTSVKIQYFITDGDDAIEIEKGKSNIKKAAQADPAPDSPLRFLRNQLKAEWRNKIDEKPVKLQAPKATEYIIYKILHDDNGTLRSVYSGEEYVVGKSKTQKAHDDHNGGYYAFLSAETAVQVLKSGNAFANHLIDGKRLVLCKGRAYGTPVAYSNGKRAFSRLVVDEIISVVE